MLRLKLSTSHKNIPYRDEHVIGNFTVKDEFIYYKDNRDPIAAISNSDYLVLFYRYDCHIHRELCHEFDIKPFGYYIIKDNFIALTDEKDKMVDAFAMFEPFDDYPTIYTRNYTIYYCIFLCIDNEFRIYDSFTIEECDILPTTYECCVNLNVLHICSEDGVLKPVSCMNELLNKNIKSELVALNVYDNHMVVDQLDEESLDKYLIMSDAKQLIIYGSGEYCVFTINLSKQWYCSELIDGNWMDYVRDYYYRPNRNTVKRAIN